ncbi:uncharacterized protein LOC120071971 [Benincasa hispida]|uniref:uncharacterized protein LOC120071971 n=1 Tax=Benincasa hispida TaxID=102211 RepID=UPI001900C04A|nr:uncharacterized protein LOC120071971 [Benincasa hispida]
MALDASIRGFLNCIRLVLIEDGTHLRGKYNAIKMSIGQVHDFVIVSDRHPSIKKAIITVFPEAFHGVCIYHLKANLLVNFKNKDIFDIFDKAAKASCESVFKYHWSQFAGYPCACKYLEDIGLERWARVYQCNRRYNQMTTNLVEYINGVLKDAQQLPITSFRWLQDLYYRRRTEASNSTSRLSDYAMTIIRDAADKASKYEVRLIDQHEFEVIDGGLGGRVHITQEQALLSQV